MTRYSDAALLRGDFAHMAAELRAGDRAAPSDKEWANSSPIDDAEAAAQAVGKQIFAIQETIDPEKERLEILTHSAIGLMTVQGIFPLEGEMLRIDGHLQDQSPVALMVGAEQLSLTLCRKPVEATKEDDDGLQIGFVIFDELAKRAKTRKPKRRPVKAKTRATKK